MGAVNLICGYNKGIILNRDADGRDGAFEGFNDPFGDWIFQFRLDGAAEIPGTAKMKMSQVTSCKKGYPR